MGELPEGWEWKRLGDLVDFKNGINFSNDQKGNVGILTIDVRNMYSDTIYPIFDNLYRVNLEPKSDYLLKKGDILFVRSSVKKEGVGWTACFNEVHEQMTFCGFIIRARLRDQSVSPEYVTYFLRTPKARKSLIKSSSQVTITNIGQEDLGRIHIPLPPLPIQRQILTVLERAEALKRQRREADALTGALLQSVFYEMFGDPMRNEKGWDVIQFGEIINETKNGLYKNEKFLGKGSPILRMYNIYQNRIILEKYHLITATEDEIQEYLVKPGDILFNRVNSRVWLGKCAVIPKDIGKFLFESKNIRIRLDRSKADPMYIVWFLSTPAGREEILKRAKDAVNQSTVNNTDLREFRILLPPLAIQQQFARIVEDVELIRGMQMESRKKIDTLSNGLMEMVFSGGFVA